MEIRNRPATLFSQMVDGGPALFGGEERQVGPQPYQLHLSNLHHNNIQLRYLLYSKTYRHIETVNQDDGSTHHPPNRTRGTPPQTPGIILPPPQSPVYDRTRPSDLSGYMRDSLPGQFDAGRFSGVDQADGELYLRHAGSHFSTLYYIDNIIHIACECGVHDSDRKDPCPSDGKACLCGLQH